MKKINYINIFLMLVIVSNLIVGCKKHTNSENLIGAPEVAHFLGKSGSKLEALSATDSIWIKVAVSTNSTATRTVTIKPVSSSAVEGTHYTISKKSLTFKPGQLFDSFCVKPIDFTMYAAGRKDTINFNIVLPDLAGADFNSSYKLIVRGPCFASDISTTEFDGLLGTYPNSQDDPSGTSPYHYSVPMTIKSWTQTGPTTAKVVINNLWDDSPSWGDISFTVDFTDPNDVHVLPVTTITAGNAGNTFGATYNGMKIIVRAHTNGAYGTLDWCSQKWILQYQIGIYNPTTSAVVGYSATVFTSSLERQ